MFTYEEQKKMKELMESNADFNDIITKLTEENRQMLSAFTHEMRNPLTLIKSTLQYISMKHPETSEFKYWNELSEDVDDTIRLLNELSVYNHCDELSYETTNLIYVLDQNFQRFQPLASEKSIELSFKKPDTSNLSLITYPCDVVKIRQVTTNLIKNALEAAKPSTKITLQLKSIPASNAHKKHIEISISNEGHIAKEVKDKIFEPFITTKSAGTGLGLAISKRIVLLHGGELNFSEKNDMTTFTVILPLDD